MVLVKATAASEAGEMPSAEHLRAMNAFNEEMLAAGVMLDGNGLLPSSHSFKLVNDGTQVRVIDGPFAETKELVAGYWLIQAKSLEEAIAWIKRAPMDFDGRTAEVEIRPLFELTDFPVSEEESGWRENEEQLRADWASDNAGSASSAGAADPDKLVYLGIVHANADSEAGVMPTEAELAKMGALVEEAANNGILLGGEGLRPSREGVRITFRGGDRAVTDGPFAETKELVGGFSLMQFADAQQAREFTIRFSEASGQEYVSVHRVATAADYSDDLRATAADVFESEARMRGQLNSGA